MQDGQQLLGIYLHLLQRTREALYVKASDVPSPPNFRSDEEVDDGAPSSS